jgi:hypothetical protein
MDTFNDQNLSAEELKMITLQFLGQNIGEIKELDKNLISRTNTLQGLTLDPHAVLNSIAPPAPVPTPSPVLQPQQAPVQLQHTAPQQVQQVASTPADPNQLELDFSKSITAEKIFDKLDSLERKLNSIIECLNSQQKSSS